MLRRRLRGTVTSRRQHPPVAAQASAKSPASLLPRFAMGQAIAKTITYRLIVTTLDFTTNYIVIGELATAAGLSTFNLVARPLFYFAHEAGLELSRPSRIRCRAAASHADRRGSRAGRRLLPRSHCQPRARQDRHLPHAGDHHGLHHQLCGGRQYRTGGHPARRPGFVLGPFVYYGHEKAWDYFGERSGQTDGGADDTRLLPAPA